jgi:hypothetical protein
MATASASRRLVAILAADVVGYEQQYFADGITEDLTTDLSRLENMFVIRNKPIDTKQIGRELGVRYVLEGSIRCSGELVTCILAADLSAELEQLEPDGGNGSISELSMAQADAAQTVDQNIGQWRRTTYAADWPAWWRTTPDRQTAPLLALQHRGVAGLDQVRGTPHRRGRVGWCHLAGDQPVEQHPHRRELLLHAGRRVGLSERLYIGGDIERPDRGQRQLAVVAPREEPAAARA